MEAKSVFISYKTEEYKEIENQPIAYNEDGEVFYIIDITKKQYEKMKY